MRCWAYRPSSLQERRSKRPSSLAATNKKPASLDLRAYRRVVPHGGNLHTFIMTNSQNARGKAGTPQRTAVFVDGFNLYHSLKDSGQNHWKWLDLRALAEKFARAPSADLGVVYYFSAFATWMPASHARHRSYVAALEATGVTPVLGRFKNTRRRCGICRREYSSHEEKETDVNIGVYLFRDALRDKYDTAIILSQDSDLAAAIRIVRREFPEKRFLILTPIGRRISRELLQAAGGDRHGRQMRRSHIESCLLPGVVTKNPSGEVAATRPPEYDPPSN